MRKTIRHMALLALTAALLTGQAAPAFADDNYGPGMFIDNPQPETNTDTAADPATDSQAADPTQTADSVPGQETAPADGSATTPTAPAGTETAPTETAPAQTDPTQTDPAQGGTSEAIPPNIQTTPTREITESTPCLQFQFLRPDMTWSDPVRTDVTIMPGADGFYSMSVYAINLPGDVLYRTYASQRGWSSWAMNGGHTDWDTEPVEAVQVRLTGVFGNTFDVYYTSTLNDGTQCDWSKNGGTNGSMATGRYITGFRYSLWGANDPNANYVMDNPLVAAAADGITIVDGMPVFSNGTGALFTGWVWNDSDRYYVVDNTPVTGWQYIDGYKYFFEADGKLVQDLEPYLQSKGPFQIRINKQMNCTTVYIQDGGNGYIIPYKTFLCSTGDDTPLGTFQTPVKYRWRLMNTDEYCQYCTRLGEGLSILLHSVIYERPDVYTLKPSTYNWLGATKSHGCIRFTTRDAKWIYDNCPLGTAITVYESATPGPFDRPAIQQMIPDTQTYDPTDVNVPENGLQ